MADPEAAKRPTWHVQYLDSLRGLAVLGVLVVHIAWTCGLGKLPMELAFTGQRGVQLFYIVSAFTLTLSHESRRSREGHSLRNFFLRRFFRLAPMYYATILLTICTLPAIAGSVRDLVLGVLFLQGISPESILHVAPGTWSIADEAFFYCCLPVLLRYIRSLRSAVAALLVLTPLMGGLSQYLAHDSPRYEYFSFFWFPVELPVFLMGIAAYFFWKEQLAGRWSASGARSRLVSFGFLAGAAVLYSFNLPQTNRKLYLGSAMCALLVLALAVHPWKLLVNRATVFLGRISFSLYLLHPWFVELTLKLTASAPGHMPPFALFALRFSVILLLTGAAATVTWLYIEETGIRLGRKLTDRLEARAKRRDTQIPAPLAVVSGTQSSAPDEQF